MKRFLALVTLGSAALAAHAQTPAFLMVQDTFSDLRTSDTVWLRMDARNEIGNKPYDYAINLYWYRGLTKSGQTVYKLESTAQDASGLIRRTVGDGRTFWVYEAPSNTYSSEIYWPEGANQPATYQSQLLEAFSRSTRGSESYLARLIQEVYGSQQATYRPWVIADAGNSVLTGPSAQAQDPMNPNDPNAVYTTGPNEDLAIFWAARPNQAAHRCIAFRFTIDQFQKRHLAEIEYRNIQSTTPWRFDSYTIQVTAGVAPAASNFIFVPPQNARAIVTTRPGIG